MAQIVVLAGVLVMLATMNAFAQASASECQLVLKSGLITRTVLTESPVAAAAFHAWMCTTRFVNHQEFVDAGVAVGVEAYGKPLSPGMSFSITLRDAWKRTNCSPTALGKRQVDAALVLYQLLSANNVQRFVECSNQMTSRLACTVVPKANGAELIARWKGSNSMEGIAPQLLGIEIAGALVNSKLLDPTTSAMMAKPGHVLIRELARDPCTSVAADISTTFGRCTIAPYVPALNRRDETQWSEAISPQVVTVPTQNLGHLVRQLQIETRTVELMDRSGEITDVTYQCRNPVNFDRCPYSRNPDTEDTSGNITIAPDRKSFQWKRLWSGDPVDEIYTVRYRVPRTVCVENCACPLR